MEPRKYAEVAELADAQDLKSCETYTFVPVRFRSSAPYLLNIAEWSSWQLVGLITRRSQVQVLSPQPFKYYGSLVKRSRHRPFTAVTGVRFPYESPCGCSSMVEFRPSKPAVRVRSPSPAPFLIFSRDHSSAGRAPALQAGGHRFEPCWSHHLKCGLVVQLVRMPACHAGGRGFESLPGRQFNMLVWLNGRAADL